MADRVVQVHLDGGQITGATYNGEPLEVVSISDEIAVFVVPTESEAE